MQDNGRRSEKTAERQKTHKQIWLVLIMDPPPIKGLVNNPPWIFHLFSLVIHLFQFPFSLNLFACISTIFQIGW